MMIYVYITKNKIHIYITYYVFRKKVLFIIFAIVSIINIK